MFNRKPVLTACGSLLGLLLMIASAVAWPNPTRGTYLTFSAPVGLPGITLAAGTYVFELPNPHNSLDIVRVMNRERSQVYFSAFTELVTRPASVQGDQQISFREASAGEVTPIDAWYPLGESTGHRFIYREKR
jgi:hypothetical protein